MKSLTERLHSSKTDKEVLEELVAHLAPVHCTQESQRHGIFCPVRESKNPNKPIRCCYFCSGIKTCFPRWGRSDLSKEEQYECPYAEGHGRWCSAVKKAIEERGFL
jgi:hypothetical protein